MAEQVTLPSLTQLIDELSELRAELGPDAIACLYCDDEDLPAIEVLSADGKKSYKIISDDYGPHGPIVFSVTPMKDDDKRAEYLQATTGGISATLTYTEGSEQPQMTWFRHKADGTKEVVGHRPVNTVPEAGEA